jgi:UDP-perosamine 4-acetyltransferase
VNTLADKILIVGGGGHSMVIIEVFRAMGCEPAGILDPHFKDREVLGVAVLGGDDQAEGLFEAGYRRAHVAIGNNPLRRRLGENLKKLGYQLVNAIHPSAVISPTAELGDGIAVMPNAVVHTRAKVSTLAIINTGAIVEHDCFIGVAAHIAPRSVMGGNVVIGDEVLFGIGSVARPLSCIGSHATVGAGAVVIGAINPGAVVTGVPARPAIVESRGKT